MGVEPRSPLLRGVANLSDDLGDELAEFARRHLRRLCCLDVMYLAGKGSPRFTPTSLARDCGWSINQATEALDLLTQSGLLIKVRGPRYVLTSSAVDRSLLSRLVEMIDADRLARTTLLNFALVKEVNALEDNLATRGAVEQAKGLIMLRHGLTEEQAQRLLIKTSRDSGQSLRATAEQILRG
jgi:hypothetical protein